MILAQELLSEPSPDGMLSIVCTLCGSPLALHQPDPGQPERLLGICDECRTWFLIDEQTELIAPLPGRLSRPGR
jgi:hypothetical protein